MNSRNNQDNITDYYEGEIVFWETISILFRNWKSILLIVLAFLFLGLIYSFFVPAYSEYTFSNQIIYDDYEFYPIDFPSTYKISLGKYIEDELNAHKNTELQFKKNNDAQYILTVKFLGLSSESVNKITQDIIKRHNDIMLNELTRLTSIKEQEVDTAYNEYTLKQTNYSNFLYKEDGYHSIENDLNRYISYINSFEKQLENRKAMLQKVQNGFPLLLEDIYLDEGMPIEYYEREQVIEDHYSADSIQKEIEFLEEILKEYTNVYAEICIIYDEITITNITVKSERDYALKAWQDRGAELEILNYNLTHINEYYINNSLLDEDKPTSYIIYLAIFLVLGILISIVYVLLRNSYLNYKKSTS